MTEPVKIENRIYYSRSDIEHLIAEAQGLPAGADIEVEWYDDHSAVIVLPDDESPTRPADDAL